MLLFLLLSLLVQGQTVTAPRETEAIPAPRAAAPLAHENLSIVLLENPEARSLGDFITLEEGLRARWVGVSETALAQVGTLVVENRSLKPCFLQAGDGVRGGKQDRVIATDRVLGPKSGRVAVPAFCVESGRWSSGSGFGSSPGLIAGASLREAVQGAKDQGKVWEAVREAKERLVRENALGASRSTSLNEQLLDIRVQRRLAGFAKNLGKACDQKPHAVGLVVVVNGRPTTADVYADPGLFRKLYPRLLAAAAVEAMSVPSHPSEGAVQVDLPKLLADKGAARFGLTHGGVELHRQYLFR